ncbi:hypothetical protein Acr_03g0008740 [Actinidia rufa]|uniref:Uncharacterized protein n=1 Tax=Actinidia rufa TaxID=165716 RepID=A0A7J0ECI6_9ERIC|nr:hypothetical protein Acr_03g0008740 [Actinidia rufa]
MVKLASSREIRMYGPRLGRNRAEYINAGLYVFATVVLLGGFVAQLSKEPKSGLVLLLMGLGLIVVVNVHDLVAHLAGIDFRFQLMGFDTQLALVEFAVPLVQAAGSVLFFLGILFLFIQEEKGYGYFKLEKHALNTIIAGLLCAVLNCREQAGQSHHGLELLGGKWVWLCIFGSILFFVGGLTNVVKVFEMQQNSMRLEKLRGGAQERLVREREGQVPLILEEQGRRRKQAEEAKSAVAAAAAPTPYKDVLVGPS